MHLVAQELVCRIPGNQVSEDMNSENKTSGKAPSILAVLGSVLSSMFGVQSSRKREEDFTHGKPSQYIMIGLLVTVVFVLTVWGVVKLVMNLAGV
jgi:hypothetical protein